MRAHDADIAEVLIAEDTLRKRVHELGAAITAAMRARRARSWWG